MGNRAIYTLIERGESNYFYSHMGANALSPLLRLTQAKELQTKLSESHSLAYIFEHLDYDGQYQNPRLMDADMFCERIEPISIPEYEQSYAQRGELEMKITIDLDENDCLLEYNPNCPWYCTMGSFSIDLDAGVENVRRLLAHAEDTVSLILAGFLPSTTAVQGLKKSWSQPVAICGSRNIAAAIGRS
ncbi:hypothetical protein [Lacrimispora brassicae]